MGLRGVSRSVGGGASRLCTTVSQVKKRSFTSFPRGLTLDIISTLEGELRLENWGLKGRGDQRDH